MAWLRMCSSSPMFSPWAARSNTSTGPRRSNSAASRGPSSSRKKRSRSTDSSSPTPNHSVLPGPSFSVENARRSPSSTTQTGIEGEQTPVIGPTWPCSLPGSSAISPRASSAAASSREAAQPSNSAAAVSARRCGSHTRSQAIGGPECSSSPSRSPGTTEPAGATVTARGDAPSIASTARAFASATASPCAPHSPVSSSTAAASPPAGGRQSTSTTGAPWSRSASANVDSPRLTA